MVALRHPLPSLYFSTTRYDLPGRSVVLFSFLFAAVNEAFLSYPTGPDSPLTIVCTNACQITNVVDLQPKGAPVWERFAGSTSARLKVRTISLSTRQM